MSTRNVTVNHLQRIAVLAAAIATLVVAGIPTAEGIMVTKKPKEYTVRPVVQDGGVDGLNLTGLDDAVPFDLDGNGTVERVTWTMMNADTGFFWVDLNGNGQVDSGRELFGSDTQVSSMLPAGNGFAALAQYDLVRNGGNGDGVLSAADAIWPRLQLWVDWNHDGQVEAGEVSTMGDLHIQTIDLTSQPVNLADPRGNYVLSSATVHAEPGYEDGWVLDVLFQRASK
ncbi:MAG: hypothetical protein ACM3O7_07605 [Acidobacteriota bacterium]